MFNKSTKIKDPKTDVNDDNHQKKTKENKNIKVVKDNKEIKESKDNKDSNENKESKKTPVETLPAPVKKTPVDERAVYTEKLRLVLIRIRETEDEIAERRKAEEPLGNLNMQRRSLRSWQSRFERKLASLPAA